jgi:uncharacterized protein
MDDDLLELAIMSILENKTNDLIEFIWHGGEPTLLPINHYQKVVSLQSKYKKKNQIIINRLQTNGTLINYEWARFIKKNNFMIGISIDGPPHLHNKQRVFANGKGSFEEVSRAINLLQSENIPFMTLMVIDRYGIDQGARRIFDFFCSMRIKNFGLLAATPLNIQIDTTQVDHYITPFEFKYFLIEMYECWKQHADYSIRIRELDDLIRIIYGKKPGTCTLSGKCFGKYFIIEPNGSVAHCELFQGDTKYTIGNIQNMTFEEIQKSQKISELEKENAVLLQEMTGCSNYQICKGWCPHETYLSSKFDPNYDSKCCGLNDLINHIRNNPPIPLPMM